MALQSFLVSEQISTTESLGTTDDAVVALGVTLAYSGTFTAIQGTGSGHSVTVAGQIYSSGTGIFLGDNATADSNQQVVVSATGSIQAEGAAISTNGGNTQVTINGDVSGGSYTVYITSEGVGVSRVVNSGTITATGEAVYHAGGEDFRLVNLGRIVAGNNAFASSDASVDRVTNHGVMIGSVNLNDGDDQITNFGTIDGTVYLGEGSDTITVHGRLTGGIQMGGGTDTYIARASIAQNLSVDGGDDNDSFVIGSADEYIDGGTGIDTVSVYGTGRAANIDLMNVNVNTGAALNDIFVSIENLSGTNYGDRQYGSDAANQLNGVGGRDALFGRLGADTLIGGAGIDTQAGGGGNDRFMFYGLADCGDSITDYGNVVGNNDSIHILASTFGGGLTAGSLAPSQYRARTDGLAQDADDRFVFNTTTRALWFDANGNGAGGRTMVADLQAAATFSLADIVLI